MGDHQPWLEAAEQLSRFDVHRCVMLTSEEWRELSAVFNKITTLCSSLHSRAAAPVPGFVYTLELLLQLGRVTSCLLSLNGDDPAFSVARVAQSIRCTTTVLETCVLAAPSAGLPHDIADSLALQRCEQTPLLSAMAWALRQEARALFFNPRPTALSLATALLDLFRAISMIWPDDIFAPDTAHAAPHTAPHAAHTAHDPSAARLADPAAQLAMAMLRCAGRAVSEIGASASKQIMVSGLRVAQDLMHQISSVIARVGESPGEDPLVKQLLQSTSILQLMLTVLAIQTQRLQQQLGMGEEDSFTVCHPVEQWQPPEPPAAAAADDDAAADPAESGHTAAAAATSKQQTQQTQQQQHHGDDSDEDWDHAGAGDLHQLWNEVLGMARKQAAVQQPEPQPDCQALLRTPLLQLWKLLGLPEPMLSLAASSDVFTAAADGEYIAACKVARFLLQGSSHLQPSRENPAAHKAAAAAAAAAGFAGEGPAADGGDLSPATSPTSPASPAALVARAMSPSAEAAALLVDSCRDYGLKGQEELEVLHLQRLVPLVLLDTAATITSHLDPAAPAAPAAAGNGGLSQPQQQQQHQVPPNSSRSSSSSSNSALDFIAAACAAAACSARCWPVLQKVAAVPDGWSSSSLAGAAPTGVFTGLSSVYWQQYELPPDDHLPLQELLQLVVEVFHQVLGQQQGDQQQGDQQQGDQQQRQLQQQQQPYACMRQTLLRCAAAADAGTAAGAADIIAAATALVNAHVSVRLKDQQGSAGVSKPAPCKSLSVPTPITITPKMREAFIALLEVLAAVSKLAWEPTHDSLDLNNDEYEEAASRHSRAMRLGAKHLDNQYVAYAWQVMCQPVAAAVEACLRATTNAWTSVGGTAAGSGAKGGQASSSHSAVIPAAAGGAGGAGGGSGCVVGKVNSCLPPALLAAAAAAGTSPQVLLQLQRKAAVALGSCLAALCAPLGRPGPLVAAAAAAEPGGPVQLQLFALLTSKVKLLLSDQTGKREIIAMHPIEQTPVYVLERLFRQRAQAHAMQDQQQQQELSVRLEEHQHQQQQQQILAAAVPWLVVLGRLLMLRGQLLGELLQRDAGNMGCADRSSESLAMSTLHNAFWHIKMAEASATVLEAHLGDFGCCWAAGQLAQQPAATGEAPAAAAQHEAADRKEAEAVAAFDLQQSQQQVHHELLPALKHAEQLCKAAIKLARHYHETGFASGFASGFAAGYAAAVAAGAGGAAAAAGAGESIGCASPWGVLQQSCIRNLPQRLQAFGAALCSQLLLPYCCAHPSCVTMSYGSELQLVGPDAVGLGCAVVCGKCKLARYCSEDCKMAHKSRHKHVCKRVAELYLRG